MKKYLMPQTDFVSVASTSTLLSGSNDVTIGNGGSTNSGTTNTAQRIDYFKF